MGQADAMILIIYCNDLMNLVTITLKNEDNSLLRSEYLCFAY